MSQANSLHSSRVIHMHESCHTYECVVSYTCDQWTHRLILLAIFGFFPPILMETSVTTVISWSFRLGPSNHKQHGTSRALNNRATMVNIALILMDQPKNQDPFLYFRIWICCVTHTHESCENKCMSHGKHRVSMRVHVCVNSCMWVSVYISMLVCMYMSMHIHMHKKTGTHVYIFIRISKYVHSYAYTHVCMCMRVCTHTHAYMYTCKCVFVRVCMCTPVYVYTYIYACVCVYVRSVCKHVSVWSCVNIYAYIYMHIREYWYVYNTMFTYKNTFMYTLADTRI